MTIEFSNRKKINSINQFKYVNYDTEIVMYFLISKRQNTKIFEKGANIYVNRLIVVEILSCKRSHFKTESFAGGAYWKL